MKCKTHPAVDAVCNCADCDDPLCSQCNVSTEDTEPRCSRCAALAALSEFDEDEESRAQKELEKEQEKAEKNKPGRFLQYAVIVAAMVIVPYQFSGYFIQSDNLNADDLVLTDPDEITDECIYNLFLISEMLLAGQTPGDDIKCPASDDPYIVTVTNDDIIVRDPHPELHGYIEMSVSRNNPEPIILE